MKYMRFFGIALASCVGSAFAQESQVSFSTAFSCNSNPNEGTCLSEPFQSGQPVVLLKKDNSGVCIGKTGEKYTYEGMDRNYEGTRLIVLGDCSGPFNFAVVNSQPSSVRLSNDKADTSILHQREKQARAYLNKIESSFPSGSEEFLVSQNRPRVLVAGNNVLLAYTMKTNSTFGPTVLFLGDHAFVSETNEWCTTGHTFFYVKEKLHLGYFEVGCGGGYTASIVRDLSSGTPKEIYVRGRAS